MGNTPCGKNGIKEIMDQDLKESWKYKGAIYQIEKDLFQNQEQYKKKYSLSGNIYIKVFNRKHKIEIQGKIKGKKIDYNFHGEEISRIKNYCEEKFSYKIAKDNNFQLNIIELNKYNNGIANLMGDKIYIKEDGVIIGPLYLDLYLKDHKEYSNEKKFNIGNIDSSVFHLSKLINQDNQEDILINSLCGMRNLINTCYINSSLQILIHIPQFIRIILKNSDFENIIIKEIYDIYKDILVKYKEYRPVINPKPFVNYFKSNHYSYNNYSEIDSEMFLSELIWDINIELGNLCEERSNKLFQKKTKMKKNQIFLII